MLSPAEKARSRVNAGIGKNVVKMGTDEQFAVKRIPIGILSMERITGGGFIRGRHAELFGDEGAGKSLTAYSTMVLAQQRGEVCGVIDAEHIFDEAWFRFLGGDPDELLMAWPETAEETVQALMLFAQPQEDDSGVSVVCVDSVASLLPREELEHDIGDGKDDRVASRARLMSRGLRRATTVNRDTAFIWTNHTIEKIGSWAGGKTTPGGRSLGFYATLRVEMLRGKKVREERTVAREGKLIKKEQAIGHWVHIRCEKNKSTRPYQEQMFFFDAENKRVDPAIEIIHLGLEDGLIEQGKVGKSVAYLYTADDGTEYEGTLKDWRGWIDDEEDVLRKELEGLITDNTKSLADG